jgi:hypothetical protein
MLCIWREWSNNLSVVGTHRVLYTIRTHTFYVGTHRVLYRITTHTLYVGTHRVLYRNTLCIFYAQTHSVDLVRLLKKYGGGGMGFNELDKALNIFYCFISEVKIHTCPVNQLPIALTPFFTRNQSYLRNEKSFQSIASNMCCRWHQYKLVICAVGDINIS